MRLTAIRCGGYWGTMNEYDQGATIVAIATPPGAGGIGVVRMSGLGAKRILEALWRGRTGVSDFESHKLYLGEVACSQTQSSIIDRVMAVIMSAPKTYTGEDVVELSCHGSMVVLRQIIDACIASGARLAAPGEFTRRAFLAGKIDLAEAEGVADLINATNERAARLASDQLNGRLSHEVISIGERLANLRAEIEASIDFPEEDIPESKKSDIERQLADIAGQVKRLSATYNEGRFIRDGVRVAIVGRPNTGKSSLFNALVGQSRAIVHHAPGTTRDVIEESVSFDGLVFKLRDTAGIRSEAGDVEGLGIERSMNEIAEADLVIALFDGSKELCDEDKKIAETLKISTTVAVINKIDLPQKIDRKGLSLWLNDCPAIDISAKEMRGIERVAECLVSSVSHSDHGGDSVVITSARHKGLLDESAKAILAASISLREEPIECTAAHLSSAQDSLGAITGRMTTEALLDRIFSQFCIGK